MTLDDKPRLRTSAKQDAKNRWSINATVEFSNDIFNVVENKDDVADITQITIGDKLLALINDAEKKFRADGRKIVGDPE